MRRAAAREAARAAGRTPRTSSPLLVIGPGAERAGDETFVPVRPDRFVPEALAGDALVREVRESLRLGRVRPKPPPVVLGLSLVAVVAFLVRMGLGIPALVSPGARTSRLEVTAFVVFVAAALAAGAVALASRPRPLSPVVRRRMIGWGGWWVWWTASAAPGRFGGTQLAEMSLALAVWAVWAWLGPRVKPRSRGGARALHALAVAFAGLAVAPWMVLWVLGGP